MVAGGTGKPEKVSSRRGAATVGESRERRLTVRAMGHLRTDLVLNKPAGQLLRRTVSFPLEAPDEDGSVDSLHVEGPVHGLFLCGVGALVVAGDGGARLGAGAGPRTVGNGRAVLRRARGGRGRHGGGLAS